MRKSFLHICFSAEKDYFHRCCSTCFNGCCDCRRFCHYYVFYCAIYFYWRGGGLRFSIHRNNVLFLHSLHPPPILYLSHVRPNPQLYISQSLIYLFNGTNVHWADSLQSVSPIYHHYSTISPYRTTTLREFPWQIQSWVLRRLHRLGMPLGTKNME